MQCTSEPCSARRITLFERPKEEDVLSYGGGGGSGGGGRWASRPACGSRTTLLLFAFQDLADSPCREPPRMAGRVRAPRHARKKTPLPGRSLVPAIPECQRRVGLILPWAHRSLAGGPNESGLPGRRGAALLARGVRSVVAVRAEDSRTLTSLAGRVGG
ncbi:hypothetical protein E2C01_027567 [Portunus trituberculatus]|uniref:Uncharacterized protein n=1 Tax=Portunus trituberculatus TaxID=210409 RepID=A0A5B7EL74_PORTR|nr:hypothetical protein [Portunus trituberculatus]